MSEPQNPSGGLNDNVVGMLAYITIIPAIVFLAMEPYNKKPFIRFHAFQCLFLTGAAFIVQAAIKMSFLLLNVFAFALLPLYGLVGLAFLAVWIVCMLKAYQGERYKLPVIGDMANQQAGSV